MEFRLLGPLAAVHAGTRIELGGPRERAVLAALLLRANEIASMAHLVESVWDRPPASPKTNLRTYVSSLRRRLGRDRVHTREGGYLLRVEPGELDLTCFEDLLAEADAELRGGDARQAVDRFAQALELWRGEPADGLATGPLLRAELTRLAERRLTAVEHHSQARIELGEHRAVVDELRPLLARHPLREELWAQLMTALCRVGRRAEALDAYLDVRRRLVEELGVEPGPRLRSAHAAVLRDEATPLLAPVCQLPADVPDFTGRAEQLDNVLAALAPGTPGSPAPVVVVFGGPGVGKSTLALRAAHGLAGAFPDGQLYLDLVGTSDSPREPAALLTELLRALGVTGAGVPDEASARATLFRSLLAERRMLLVLDDAAHGEQVRPLLPAAGGCAVLVTSRRLLTDLAGARHVELGVLREEEAHHLLASIVGAARVAGEPEEAGAIVRACACLPLAIRIAAGKLVGRPAWPLRLLRERLDDEARRLDVLRLGELGVRASFRASVDTLPTAAVRAFQLLGLLGPQTVPGWVLGPLLDRPDAEDVLDTLVDANLLALTGIDGTGSPRYRLHDLLRAYAAEGAADLPEAERQAAVGRLLAAWLVLATRVGELMPASLFRPPPPPDLPPGPDPVVDPLAWFEAERSALLGAIRLAVDWGFDELAWRLAVTAGPFYDVRCLYGDWRQSHELALEATRSAGNAAGEAVLRRGLGQVHLFRDQLTAAAGELTRSLELARLAGDKRAEGLAVAGLGTVERMLGRYDAALERAETALGLAVAAGDRHLEAQLRSSRATALAGLGRTDEAVASIGESLALCRRLGDTHREAVVLRENSPLFDRIGDTERALSSLRRAMEIFEELDDRRCAAYTLLRTGRLHAGHGNRGEAGVALEHAATFFAATGNGIEEAQCWELLGTLAAEEQDVHAARDRLTRALLLWRSVGAGERAVKVGEDLRRLRER